jgi:hypothetical protein
MATHRRASNRLERNPRVYERVPRLGHNSGSLHDSEARREQLCEIRMGHRLKAANDKIMCACCGAEWKDMGL